MAETVLSSLIRSFLDALQKSILPGVWSKGVSMARSGMVELEKFSDEEIILRVRNSDRPVSAKVQLWPSDEDHFCDCNDKADPCSHVAAGVAALKTGSLQIETKAEGSSTSLHGQSPEPSLFRLRYLLIRRQQADGSVSLGFERRLGDQLFLDSLVATVGGTDSGRILGPKISATQEDFRIDSALSGFLARSRTQEVFERSQSDSKFWEALFPALRELSSLELDGTPVSIGSPTVGFHFKLQDEGSGFRLKVVPDSEDSEIFSNALIRQGAVIRRQERSSIQAKHRELLRESGTFYSFRQSAELVLDILPALEKAFVVEVQTSRLAQLTQGRARAEIDFEVQGDLTLEVRARISSEAEKPGLMPGQKPALSPGQKPALSPQHHPETLPDRAAEAQLARLLQSTLFLKPGHPAKFVGHDALAFVKRARDLAAQHSGEVFLFGPGLDHFTVHAPLKFQFQGHWSGEVASSFQAEFRTGERVASPDAVLRAWSEGSSLVPLLGGGFAPLPTEALERAGAILQRLFRLKEHHQGQLPKYASVEIRALERESLTPSDRWKDLPDVLTAIPRASLPQDLTAELREYQKRGVDWLTFCRDTGIGALLADDMGLGKTLQSLCVVRGRTLIIAPASVLQSWSDQAKRFRPSLRVQLFSGSGRKLDPTADLTITSYGLLRSDSLLLDQEWDGIILDEAQTIKNPDSQVARAAHSLRARYRIALSGTPIENRLQDLWSQMEFLNPGLFGSRQDFQSEWSTPISRGQTLVADRLRRRLKPLILRRLKSEVAPELPPKTEVVLHCDLSQEEQTLYQSLLQSTRQEVLQYLDENGSTLHALELLLRLRQASCHPALIPGQSSTSSAKLDLLLENLETTTAEGHRALVFSQWTSMLDLIEPRLKQSGISFLRLDGSTPDRARVVDAFQAPNGPAVLLLSLKAGGVGLTLTAADHVFLMDSWWNPAVENQAADRAYRIGQERPVLVCRLITRNTVEEKILELQERKKALAEGLVSAGAGEAPSGLSREDLRYLLQE